MLSGWIICIRNAIKTSLNIKLPVKTKIKSVFFDNNLAKVTDKDTRNALYSSVSDLPIISSGMLGANALEIAQNKKFSQKLKHTTGYLVNDTLIPLIFLSVSSALTKGLKPVFRIPAVFLSLFTGTLVTRKIFDKISK